MRTFILFISILYSLKALSQNYCLDGNISANDPDDIIVGNVHLMDLNNNLIKSAIVEDGSFSIKEVSQGEYLLVTTCFGFERKDEHITINENKTIDILLQKKTISLNEIVITGKKQVFINKDGNIKVNVENPFFSSLSDPVELLEKIPGIQISPGQESINIIGKGSPLIYLGNRKITLDDIKSLSIEDIKSIEIINNPSSKYEAEGRAVILITRKEKDQEGYKISLSERIAIKKFVNNNLGTNLSLLKNRFELRANVEYNQLKVWEKNGFDFNIKDKDIQSDYITEAITTRPQIKLGIGAHYQINENNYFSIDINGRPLYETYPITTVTHINDQGKKDTILTHNNCKNDGIYYSGNINYEKRFSQTDSKLFFGGQYSLFDKKIKSNIYDTYQSLDETFNLIRKQNYKVNSYSFKVDYEQKFKNNIVWEMGTKASISNANTKMEISNENIISSTYNYDEYIYAAYTQLSGETPYFSYSAGIRVENTDIHKDMNISNENYTNYFPKASITFPITDSNNLNLNYSRSTIRPNYSSSSQLDIYINPFYVISGNINLKPCITDEISVNLQIKKVSFGVNYYQNRNPIYFKTEYHDNNKLLSLIYANFQKEEGCNINITLPVTYKSFSSTNTLTGIYNKVKDKSALDLDTKPYLYYYSNNQLTLPAKYIFTISGWGMTERKEGIFERNALFIMDIGLSKTFFNKLDCSLMVSDIFGSMKFDEKFILNNIDSKGTFYTDSKAIALTLKYTFGKDKTSIYKNQSIEDNLYRMK